MLDGLCDQLVGFSACDTATLNRVRAWARRNNATVKASRYARDAHEGNVKIRSPWNEGAAVAQRKAAEVAEILRKGHAQPGAGSVWGLFADLPK